MKKKVKAIPGQIEPVIHDPYRIFCSCRRQRHNSERLMCADSLMVIKALEDAQDEMSDSNWHNDKFDRAIKLVKRYTKEHGIPKRFV